MKLCAHRFMEKVDINEATGCWLWKAYRNRKGYGTFWDIARRQSVLAHRKRRTIRTQDGVVTDHVTGKRWRYREYERGDW